MSAHHVGAILEEVRSQQALMLEAIASWGERLERKFDTEFARVNERLTNLEAAVLQSSRDIKKNSEDIRKNSEDIKKSSDDIARLNAEVAHLREEIRLLRAEFEARQERTQIAALESRVTRLEQHLKIG